ncbi:MAG: hypothetical protein EOP48_19070 [Sphingobacteriales bacterium]|nr:MAG: hypothetical protein EOP48_19070 [Sphingobacteriales bacterium]
MGLFSFFNRKNGYDVSSKTTPVTLPDIPENLFIEKEKSDNTSSKGNESSIPENGIYSLFRFIEQNYESKGYDDALVNPDSTHLEQHTAALKNDLERNIRKVKTYYEDFIKKTEFKATLFVRLPGKRFTWAFLTFARQSLWAWRETHYPKFI